MKRYRVVNPIRFITFLVLLALLIVMGVSLIKFHTVEATEGDLREVKHTGIPQVYVSDKNISKWTTEPTKDIQTETYTVTAYCPCVKCCGEWSDGITFSGDFAHEGVTIAADLLVLPLGTKVYIEGIGERIVQDKGGGIRGNHIDLFFYNHQAALEFGRQELEVEIID